MRRLTLIRAWAIGSAAWIATTVIAYWWNETYQFRRALEAWCAHVPRCVVGHPDHFDMATYVWLAKVALVLGVAPSLVLLFAGLAVERLVAMRRRQIAS